MGLYIITTIISWLFMINIFEKFEKKIKEKGYTSVKTKKKLSDSIIDWIKAILLMSIPGFNIIITTLIQIFKERKIDDIIADWVVEGKLVRNDPNVIIDVTIKDVDEYQKEEELEELIINKNNDLNRGYSTQTAEDKLEELKVERDFLLKEKENQTTFENDIDIQHELKMNRPWYFDED